MSQKAYVLVVIWIYARAREPRFYKLHKMLTNAYIAVRQSIEK